MKNILVAICLLALTADAAELVGPRGTLTVDENGVSLAPRDSSYPAIVAKGGAPWTLTLQTSARQLTLTASGQEPREEATADGIRVVYDNLTDGTNTWKIGLTFDIRAKQDAFEITGELRNETKDALVRELTCVFTGIAATDSLLWPNGLGQRFTAASKPGERVSIYPSRNGSMQWCAFAGQRGGLYLGSHDPSHGAKTFKARFGAESSLAIHHQPFCRSGQRWTLPPMVLLPYSGSWHVAARHYRAWFDSVRTVWPQRDWVRDSSGWLLCILKQQNGLVMWEYPSLKQLCDIADQRGLDILGLFGWAQGGHDHEYPDYIPDPKMGGRDALCSALAEVRRRGKRTILYANGQLIDMDTEFYRVHGKDVAVQQEDGTPFRQDWQKYRSFPAVKCVLACQSAPKWFERMRSLALQAHELGADGILFDQLGMTGPIPCWATNHGHAAPTMAYTDDRIAWLRRIADEMKRIAPNFIVMTEGLHDSVLDSIELFHGCVFGEFVPTGKDDVFPEMFRYTFPEVLNTQRHSTPMLNRLGANYACVYGLRHEVESRYAPDVRYLKEGIVPARADYADVLNPPNVTMMNATPPAEATRYLKQVIDFERRHAALLWRGRFVDDEGFQFKGEHIIAKAYAAGNQLGILVWNKGDQPATFSLNVPQAKLVTASEPEHEKVEPFSPLPAQSVRLLVWEKPAPVILTPKPGPQPRINGAKTFGVRPGHPILYTIAATGQRPMKFSATGLPAGARLDEKTGHISGSVAKRGTYRIMLRAENALGRAERELRLVVGDDICLTPLLGCNTWGGWGAKVTDANLRAAAEAMVRLDLINHGWQYINIDDGWQGKRGDKHNAIQPNEKFPDMRSLCDYIHSRGLKAGIYSTPWTTSYAGFVGGSSDDPNGAWEEPKRTRDGYRYGKHFFETNDARQWAEWGFDYAKYDWGIDSVEVTRRMADALAGCKRDIVLELSNSMPLKLAPECVRLAQLSRTTGDLVDFWDRSRMDAGLGKWAVGIREVMLEHDAYAPFQRPGHWNHACNLRVGLLGGWRDKPLTPTHLTPDEQYSHISLWCLWSSPMIIGTPIERLDEFTLSLLSNDEVLEINQDPLGKQAVRTEIANGGEILVKDLEDGTKAVGIFNPGTEATSLTVSWSQVGVSGSQRARDLWRQKDLGVFADRFETKVPSHGVVLVKLISVTPQARSSPEWLTRGVMYQIQPRAFTPEGTLKAAQARLPKLAELGVTILYLCPIFVSDDDMDQAGWSPRQKKSGMNNPRNPYRMKDYYHVDPEYGTDDDLRAFVKRAHELKMRVMLDMVYLHCGPKAVFLEQHPDFVLRDKNGKMVLKAWNFPGLNLANPELREYLWRNMEWWVRDFDVDGFRCDVADGIPLDFWETARERLEKLRPDIGMLAEGTRKTDQLKAFDLDYGWAPCFKTWDNAAAIRKQWEKMRDERPRGGAKFVRFIDNHDIANDDYENRVEKRWGASKVNAVLAVLFTLDGVPFLYNGQEVADTARHSIYARLPTNWANGETAAGKTRFAFCQKLCALRRSEPSLTQGEVVWLDTDQPDAVIAFRRKEIFTVVNLSNRKLKVKVELPAKYDSVLADGAKLAAGIFDLEAFGYFVGKTH